MNSRCFTKYENRLVNVLQTEAKIRSVLLNEAEWKTYTAIWDTGATHTAITERVVKECGLVPIGMARVRGAHGSKDVQTFIIDVMLPSEVMVGFVTASQLDGVVGSADVLIGMDIIALGDFAVGSKKGLTLFSFRIPPQGVDFLPPDQQVNPVNKQ